MEDLATGEDMNSIRPRCLSVYWFQLMSSFGLDDRAVKPFIERRSLLAPASEYPLAIGLILSLTFTTSNLCIIKGHLRRKETKLRSGGQ